MNIDIIVQARTGSKRLPGKVLMPIMGRPMIGYTLESIFRVRARHTYVVVPVGDAGLIYEIPRSTAFSFARVVGGSEDDVASRFLGVVTESRPDAFVRVCGDSPVMDWRLVNWCVDVFKETKSHLVSNVGGG